MRKKSNNLIYATVFCLVVIFTIIIQNFTLNKNTEEVHITNQVTKELKKSEVDHLLGEPINEIGSGLHVYVYKLNDTIILVSTSSDDNVVTSVIQNMDGTTTPIDIINYVANLSSTNQNDNFISDSPRIITSSPAITTSPTITPVLSQTSKDSQSKQLPEATEISGLDEYELCGLHLFDTQNTIINKLGKKYSTSYDAYDAVAWAELRCQIFYNDLIITTNRSLKMNEGDTESDDLLSEIDVSTPEYVTYRGIKVGDSLDDVMNTYQMNGYYDFNEDYTKHNMICSLLSERINQKDRYDKSNFTYNYSYGEFEKVAYIYWFDEEHPSRRPCLIFLFHDDIVTHIILYNWLYEAV